jgi:hypothetical protein
MFRKIATLVKNKRQQYSQGQVHLNSTLGMWIHLLSLNAEVRHIVEIGTWKGLGSTTIIRNAVLARSDSIAVYSLEANRQFHDIARRNIPKDGLVNLLLGSIVSVSDLDAQKLNAEEEDWYWADRKAIEDSPNVLGQLPETIELCVLDGGEFSSHAEFKILYPRLSRWLILDDTFVRKNKLVHESLLENPDWTEVSSGADRNGWAVWLRLKT